MTANENLLEVLNDSDATKRRSGQCLQQPIETMEAGNHRPPDGGFGWVIVLAAFMMNFIVFGILNTSGIIFVEILEELNTGKAETSLISSIAFGSLMVTGPLAGVLCNRFGNRAVGICGSVISSIGLFASFFSKTLLLLYVSLGLTVGLGFGLAFLPFIVCLATYFDKKKSLAVGISVCGCGVGTLVLAPLLEILVSTFGWRGSTLIEAGIALNLAVFAALLRPLPKVNLQIVVDRKIDKQQIALEESKMCDVKKVAETILNFDKEFKVSQELKELLQQQVTKDQKRTLDNEIGQASSNNIFIRVNHFISKNLDFSILKNASFVIFLLSNFFVVLGYNAPYIYLPDRAVESGRTKSESALIISIIGFANIFGRIFFGWLSDRPCVNRLKFYTVSMVICGFVTVASPLNNSLAYLVVYASIFGIFMGVFSVLFIVISSDLVPVEKIGPACGMCLLAQGIASFVGPPTAGWIYNFSNSYEYTFYSIGAVFLIGGLIICIIPFIKS